MSERKPASVSAQQFQGNRRAFWTGIQQERRSTKRNGSDTPFLEGRRQVAQYLLKRRDDGCCTGPDAWRYFDAFATCVATDQEAHELVAWAELALPLLAAQEDLAKQVKAVRGQRLTNEEFGELLQLTRGQREGYRITRRFVTETGLTPAAKREETLARKEKRRLVEERRRRRKGIEQRPRSAKWRSSRKSKSAFYWYEKWGRKAPSVEKLRPWFAEEPEMSRRTWYRQPAAWRDESVLRCLPKRLRFAYLESRQRGFVPARGLAQVALKLGYERGPLVNCITVGARSAPKETARIAVGLTSSERVSPVSASSPPPERSRVEVISEGRHKLGPKKPRKGRETHRNKRKEREHVRPRDGDGRPSR